MTLNARSVPATEPPHTQATAAESSVNAGPYTDGASSPSRARGDVERAIISRRTLAFGQAGRACSANRSVSLDARVVGHQRHRSGDLQIEFAHDFHTTFGLALGDPREQHGHERDR